MQDIEFQVDGQTLRGKLFYPEKVKGKNPSVIFIHGWMTSYKGSIPRAEALVALGYICLIFDLRGHGESDGTLGEVTTQGSLQDAIAAYDYVATLPEVDRTKISVVGSSYGGYTAALLSNKRPVASLVLRVPAIYRNETFSKPKVREIRKDLTVFRQSTVVAKDNYALQAITHYKGNLLLIESEKDVLIPHQTIQNYRNAVVSPSEFTDIVMKAADHSLSRKKWKKEYIDILVDWFNKKV